MKRTPIVLLAIMLLLAACKKKETPAVTTPTVLTPSQYFYPLKVGNYWIYQTATSGNSSPQPNDTVQITVDTIVNGITFYYLAGNGGVGNITTGYYGDSAGYILYCNASNGQLVLPDWVLPLRNIANDTLWQQLVANQYEVERTANMDTLVSVTAGAFNCMQVITDYYFPVDSPVTATNPRHAYQYYSKGVGLLYESTLFEMSTTTLSSQLISYHINP